jgi:dehydrogenase/reductase SDR family protein 1
MIALRRGLIVNISFWAAQKHIGNVAYGVSKAATDEMPADMATELKRFGVTVVSLYPGTGFLCCAAQMRPGRITPK